MLSVSELKKFHFNPPRDGLKRDYKVQGAYDEYIKDKKNLSSFLDNVNRKLDYDCYYLCVNDYPYWTEKKIKHLICWYRGPLKKTKEIYDELKTKIDIISCWKNLSVNCSIKQVHHLHIFIRTE